MYTHELDLLEKKESTIRGLYEETKRAETVPGNRDELISIGYTQDDLRTIPHLCEMQGMQGMVRRGDLLDAGYVFLNKIGAGDKPIIKAVIDEEDYGTLRLLTSEQLQKVKELQSNHPDYLTGMSNEEIDDLRFDMLHVLMVIKSKFPGSIVHERQALNMAISEMMHSNDPAIRCRAVAVQRFTKSLQGDMRFTWRQQFIDDNLREIFPLETGDRTERVIRGINVYKRGGDVSVRRTALKYSISPFLDSGYTFGTIFVSKDYFLLIYLVERSFYLFELH